MKLRKLTSTVLSLTCLLSSPAFAIINYGKDNDANTTDPGTGVPWANVSRVTNNDGSKTAGSAIYLGNGYMLTADHVADPTHVTFDGTTMWEVVPESFQQVAAGVDLKVFRLEVDPGLPALMLYEDSLESKDLNRDSVLVGWGLGRDPGDPPGTNLVTWGGEDTISKRWGNNTTLISASIVSYGSGSETYIYPALETHLSKNAGADEAAATLHDSGSALFQNIDGDWYLSGIAAVVTTNGSSLFGTSTTGDANYFVRTSSFSDEITAAIPEPSTWALFAGCGALVGTVLIRRRRS